MAVVLHLIDLGKSWKEANKFKQHHQVRRSRSSRLARRNLSWREKTEHQRKGSRCRNQKGRGANTDDGGAARANAWMLLGLFDFGISNPLETKAWSNLYSTNQI